MGKALASSITLFFLCMVINAFIAMLTLVGDKLTNTTLASDWFYANFSTLIIGNILGCIIVFILERGSND